MLMVEPGVGAGAALATEAASPLFNIMITPWPPAAAAAAAPSEAPPGAFPVHGDRRHRQQLTPGSLSGRAGISRGWRELPEALHCVSQLLWFWSSIIAS